MNFELTEEIENVVESHYMKPCDEQKLFAALALSKSEYALVKLRLGLRFHKGLLMNEQDYADWSSNKMKEIVKCPKGDLPLMLNIEDESAKILLSCRFKGMGVGLEQKGNGDILLIPTENLPESSWENVPTDSSVKLIL